jgi:hypothetical protein
VLLTSSEAFTGCVESRSTAARYVEGLISIERLELVRLLFRWFLLRRMSGDGFSVYMVAALVLPNVDGDVVVDLRDRLQVS